MTTLDKTATLKLAKAVFDSCQFTDNKELYDQWIEVNDFAITCISSIRDEATSDECIQCTVGMFNQYKDVYDVKYNYLFMLKETASKFEYLSNLPPVQLDTII